MRANNHGMEIWEVQFADRRVHVRLTYHDLKRFVCKVIDDQRIEGLCQSWKQLEVSYRCLSNQSYNFH